MYHRQASARSRHYALQSNQVSAAQKRSTQKPEQKEAPGQAEQATLIAATAYQLS
jgi:hypothetical protein